MTIPTVQDFLDGKEDLDTLEEIVESEAEFITTRSGTERRTLAGINNQFDEMQAGGFVAQSVAAADRAEVAADAAELSGNVFNNTSDGIASGLLYFSVVSPNDESYLDLYKNESGVADLKKSYPSMSFIESLAPKYSETRNLASANNISEGFYINVSNGDLIAASGQTTFDYIEAKPGVIYSHNASRTAVKMFQYDENKNIISSYTPTARYQQGEKTHQDTRFIRFYLTSSVAANISVLESNYVDMKHPLKDDRPHLDLEKHINLTVSAEETDFISKSYINLYNPDKGIEGYYISLDGSAVISTTVDFKATEFIKVSPNTLYGRRSPAYIAEYDIDKQFITAGSNSRDTVITTSETAFIRTYFRADGSGDQTIVEGEFIGEVPFREILTIKGLELEDSLTNIWRGKTIVWMGTSIPAGSGYPEKLSKSLGAKIKNISIGGGRARAFRNNNAWEGQSYLKYQFTLLKSEVNARYGHNLGKQVSEINYLTEDPSGVILTTEMLDALTFNNIEEKLIPNIEQADLFVIDYGINDRNGQASFPFEKAEDCEYDRSTFAGSVNYIIKEILERKPNAKIIIVTHFTSGDWVSANTDHVIDAQLDLAKYWHIPVVDMTKASGCNKITTSQLTSDNLHPIANGLLSDRYVKAIKNALLEIEP